MKIDFDGKILRFAANSPGDGYDLGRLTHDLDRTGVEYRTATVGSVLHLVWELVPERISPRLMSPQERDKWLKSTDG